MTEIKFDTNLTKPISNSNVSTPGGFSYNNNLENLKLPPNGPFPISYFSKVGDQLDNKLISFLKNK